MLTLPHPIWGATWPTALQSFPQQLWDAHGRWEWRTHQWVPIIPRNPFQPPFTITPQQQYLLQQWKPLYTPPADPIPWTLTRETIQPQVISTLTEWRSWCATMPTGVVLALDTETTGLSWQRDTVQVVQCAWRDAQQQIRVIVALVGLWPQDQWKPLLTQTLRRTALIIGHHLMFDGLMLHWQEAYPLWDTQIAAMLLHPQRNKLFKLAELVEELLGVSMDKTEQASDWHPPLTPQQIHYAAWDAVASLGVFEAQQPLLYAAGLERVLDLEMRTLPVLIQMTQNGLGFHREFAQKQLMPTHLQAQTASAQWADRIHAPVDLFGSSQWNPNSDQQVLKAFHQRGLLIPNTSTPMLTRTELLLLAKRYSVDPASFPTWMLQWTQAIATAGGSTQELHDLWQQGEATPPSPPSRHPANDREAEEWHLYQQLPSDPTVLEHLVEAIEWLWLYRQATKAEAKWSELLEASAHTGRLHPQYLQLVPSGTGRISTSKPQVQNIPRDVVFRQAIVPRPGHKLLLADYPQIELRILAFLTGEPKLYDAFLHDGDPHRALAATIYHKDPTLVTKAERQIGKTCFSGDTELLTARGWIRFDAYDGQTPVAQFHLPDGYAWNTPADTPWQGNGSITFTTPLGYAALPHQPLWRLNHPDLDLRMTPDHEVIGIDPYGTPYKQPLVNALHRRPRVFLGGGHWEHPTAWTPQDTAVLAMLLSQGYWRQGTLTLYLTSTALVHRALALLTAAQRPFHHTAQTLKGHRSLVTIQLTDPLWAEHVRALFSPGQPLSWDSLSQLDGQEFLQELSQWDSTKGSPLHPPIPPDAIPVIQMGPQTTDVLQAMGVLSGIRVSHTRSSLSGLSFRLHHRPVLSMRSPWKIDPEPPTTVFCVEVPSGSIIVRRQHEAVVIGNCNFGFGYGMGGDKFVIQNTRDLFLKGTNLMEGKSFWTAYHKQYTAIHHYHKTATQQATETRQVRTLSGRRRLWNTTPGYSEVLNTPSQGTGADILKEALVRVHAAVTPYGGRILSTVHDEIIVEIPAEQAEAASGPMQQAMEAAAHWIAPIPVPVEVTIADSWAEK